MWWSQDLDLERQAGEPTHDDPEWRAGAPWVVNPVWRESTVAGQAVLHRVCRQGVWLTARTVARPSLFLSAVSKRKSSVASRGTGQVDDWPLRLGPRCPQGKKQRRCGVERGSVRACMCLRGSVPSGGSTGEVEPAVQPEARLLIQTQALQRTVPPRASTSSPVKWRQ